MSTTLETIAYTDPEGGTVERRVELGPEHSAGPGAMFLIRDVHDPDGGGRLVQKRLGALDARRRVGAQARLEAEIRVLLRLVRTFGHEGYPPELARIAGHDFDGVEPFLLVDAAPCPPSADVVGKLLTDEQEDFQRAIFRTARYLEVAGVVHGDLSPATVCWQREQRRLYVGDFGHAALAGEPRGGLGAPQWAAPAPLRGPGPADSRDDVWSAAQVAYHVTTGRPVRQGRAPVGLETQGLLIDLLRGVFEDDARRRPGAVQVLERLAEPDPWVGGRAQYDPLAEGRRRYGQVLEQKRQRMPLAGQPPVQPAGPPAAPATQPPYEPAPAGGMPAPPPKPPDPPTTRPSTNTDRRRWHWGRNDSS